MEKKQLIIIWVLGLLMVLALAFSIMNFTIDKEEERTEYKFIEEKQKQEINQSEVNESMKVLEDLEDFSGFSIFVIIIIAVGIAILLTLFNTFNKNIF